MGKAPCCDKDNVKRGPWSPEEDDTLKTYIHQHGTGGNWIAFPKKAGLRRCGKSCRLRWLNYLRPDIRHGGFTEEEDIIIYTLYNQMGSRWSIIASQLHGRTDNDVKNHWNTKLKKKLLGTQTNNNGSDCNNPITVENYVNLSFPTSLNQDFQESPTMLADFNYGLPVSAQNLVNDPIIFPCPIVKNFPQFDANLVKISQSEISTTQQTSSVSASSSVSLDDQKFVQWTSHGGGEDDGFFTDTGFGLSNDFVNGFWSLEKGGEDAPTLGESVLYAADIKPQGLLQSVINNTVPY